MKYKFTLLIMLLFVSCNSSEQEDLKKTINISIKSDDLIIKNIQKITNINIDFKSSLKDSYILFTNKSNIKTDISINIKGEKKDSTQKISKRTLNCSINPALHASQYISDFNHMPIKSSSTKNTLKNIIEKNNKAKEELFYLNKNPSNPTKVSIKKITQNIKTKYGNKKLNIWVSNDAFGNNCSKSYCITQNMVDILADNFLKAGEDNDIYDWVTNIFGEEWGESNNSLLIDKNDEITILLTDIDNDDKSNGVVLGYFYAKDNYKKSIYPGSNERTMFYIDSVVFASYQDNEPWNIEGSKQKKILSTLAHEFEHMIQFYQKKVRYTNDNLQPWIDEMLAVTIEDLIATKLETNGIRGVSYTRGDAGEEKNQNGKFPLFNKNINITLPSWNNKREDYSKVGAFGSYLIRNYGGAKLLHDILHNPYKDERAITYAVKKALNGSNKSFETIMHDWGIAVLLSSSTNIDIDSGYLYNFGDFLNVPYKESLYNMGSINFFNYKNLPNLSSNIKTIEPKSNLYYKIGENLTGDIKIMIETNPNILATLIIK